MYKLQIYHRNSRVSAFASPCAVVSCFLCIKAKQLNFDSSTPLAVLPMCVLLLFFLLQNFLLEGKKKKQAALELTIVQKAGGILFIKKILRDIVLQFFVLHQKHVLVLCMFCLLFVHFFVFNSFFLYIHREVKCIEIHGLCFQLVCWLMLILGIALRT